MKLTNAYETRLLFKYLHVGQSWKYYKRIFASLPHFPGHDQQVLFPCDQSQDYREVYLCICCFSSHVKPTI